jgi:hypothetical protein
MGSISRNGVHGARKSAKSRKSPLKNSTWGMQDEEAFPVTSAKSRIFSKAKSFAESPGTLLFSKIIHVNFLGTPHSPFQQVLVQGDGEIHDDRDRAAVEKEADITGIRLEGYFPAKTNGPNCSREAREIRENPEHSEKPPEKSCRNAKRYRRPAANVHFSKSSLFLNIHLTQNK